MKVWSEPFDGRVRVWVEDNGIAFPRDTTNAFSDTIAPQRGTGIGLAIVRKAVERMNGKVGVESEPGKGSRFWVELGRAD